MRTRSAGMGIATLVVFASIHFFSLASSGQSRNPGADRIVGHIDGIGLSGTEFIVSGWACQQGINDSIDIHIYADHSAYDTPKGTFVLAGKADLENEPAVDQACQNPGGKHRFKVALPNQVLIAYQERKLYVHGIRKQAGVPNAALDGSGAMQFPNPPLTGTYKSSAQNPRVFTTQVDVGDLVARINSPGSFSAQSFASFSNQIKTDLAAKKDWDASYSGCDLDIYLHAFSYEPTTGYASEIRSESQLRTAMSIKAELGPPAGAAIVASRLALYAVLVKLGAHTNADSPAPNDAAALAKRILLAWAAHGIRDRNGNYLNAATQFCDDQGHFNHGSESAVGLQIGRGVIYSVHAQDLLQAIGALDPKEKSELNEFHAAMFDLIREASNFRAALPEMNGPDSTCERYSNHVGAHLIGLLSIARLFEDVRKFNAVLYGNDRSIPLAICWTKWFNHAVYGENDRPIACHKNSGPDSLTSHPSYQTSIVAPGEIEDRYRNATAAQAFGYSLGVLGGLYNDAEMMKIAGIDAYAYRGAHQQSIEMATQYYACYGKYVGFKKTVTSANARTCPDHQQYVGQIVNGLETDIVMGAYRFPGNTAITEIEVAAKAGAGRDLLDAIRFGRWTN